MENAENVISMLKEIRKLGIQLSIDDFGTGYSSLSYLHRFPINTLKVDRSFVSTMEDGSENGEIVRTIISLAKTLKSQCCRRRNRNDSSTASTPHFRLRIRSRLSFLASCSG